MNLVWSCWQVKEIGMCAVQQWWKIIKYIYLSTVDYNFEANVLEYFTNLYICLTTFHR